MDSINQFNADLFAGLRALTAAIFPKTCANCGEIYYSEEDFCKKTHPLCGRTGLKISTDEDDRPILELYRNCRCGSTLMGCFNDRRDTSEKGLKRRELFGKLIDMLKTKGMDPNRARSELLKMINGEKSALLEKMGVQFRIR